MIRIKFQIFVGKITQIFYRIVFNKKKTPTIVVNDIQVAEQMSKKHPGIIFFVKE